MKFEEKLIQLRKKHKLSQEQLAEKLGVSRQAISRWESGETTPDMLNLLGICNTFEVSADYLINDGYHVENTVSRHCETAEPAIPPKNRQIFRLISAGCSQGAVICAAVGLACSNSILQSFLSVICIALFSGLTSYQLVRYGKG